MFVYIDKTHCNYITNSAVILFFLCSEHDAVVGVLEHTVGVLTVGRLHLLPLLGDGEAHVSDDRLECLVSWFNAVLARYV